MQDMFDGKIASDKISSEKDAVMDTPAQAPAPAPAVDVIMIDADDPPSHLLDTARIDLTSGAGSEGPDVPRGQEVLRDETPMVTTPSLQLDTHHGHSPPDHEGPNGPVTITGNSGPDPLQPASSTQAPMAPKDVLSSARKSQSPGPHNSSATGAVASKS